MNTTSMLFQSKSRGRTHLLLESISLQFPEHVFEMRTTDKDSISSITVDTEGWGTWETIAETVKILKHYCEAFSAGVIEGILYHVDKTTNK